MPHAQFGFRDQAKHPNSTPRLLELRMRQCEPAAVSSAQLHMVEGYVREYMSRFDGSHDFEHVQRVLNLSKHLAQREMLRERERERELNWDMIHLAALVHDVGDKKYAQGGEEEPETLAKRVLVGFGVDEGMADAVQTIANHVSYSNEVKHPDAVAAVLRDYPELAVVQDADRLDALGAIGIGRAFAFGGARGRSMQESIGHFGDKLEKLESMMKTDAGREMAKERSNRLRLFKSWWNEESDM